QPLDAPNDDVRAEPPAIDAECLNRAVRGNQQRKNIEPLFPDEALEASLPADGVRDQARRLGRRPRPAIDTRLAVRSNRAPLPDQIRMLPCRDHVPARVVHLDQPVTDEPVALDLRLLESLAGQ